MKLEFLASAAGMRPPAGQKAGTGASQLDGGKDAFAKLAGEESLREEWLTADAGFASAPLKMHNGEPAQSDAAFALNAPRGSAPPVFFRIAGNAVATGLDVEEGLTGGELQTVRGEQLQNGARVTDGSTVPAWNGAGRADGETSKPQLEKTGSLAAVAANGPVENQSSNIPGQPVRKGFADGELPVSADKGQRTAELAQSADVKAPPETPRRDFGAQRAAEAAKAPEQSAAISTWPENARQTNFNRSEHLQSAMQSTQQASTVRTETLRPVLQADGFAKAMNGGDGGAIQIRTAGGQPQAINVPAANFWQVVTTTAGPAIVNTLSAIAPSAGGAEAQQAPQFAMSVQLHPKTLGEVSVHITRSGGVVNVDIRTQTVQAERLLKTDSANLLDAFKTVDAKIDEVNLRVTSSQDSSSVAARNNREGGREGFFAAGQQDLGGKAGHETGGGRATSFESERSEAAGGVREPLEDPDVPQRSGLYL